MKRLRTGIINTPYNRFDLDTALSKIKMHGYDCIDYQEFVNIETDFFKLPENEFLEELGRQKRLFSSHGIEVSQCHAPWRAPKDNDPEERKLWVLAMKKAIRGAHALGCHRFVVHPLMPYMDSGEHREEVWEMNEKFLSELADYAKEYDVTICLENMPFPVFPIATAEDCVRMVDKLNRANLKICLDTGHAAIFEGAHVARAVRTIADRLEAVHIHDNMGYQDEHLFPGEGIIDWEEFALALKELKKDVVISIEPTSRLNTLPCEEWGKSTHALAQKANEIAKKAI